MPHARSLRYGPHSYHGFAENRSSSARPVASARRACSARHASAPRGSRGRRDASPRARARRRARRAGRLRSVRRRSPVDASASVPARPRSSSHGSETWPAAGASPRFTTTSLRVPSPRQPQASRLRQASFPSQPPRLAELPGARAEDVVAQAGEQSLVEGPQVRVRLLVGPASEEDRQLDAPAVELTVVDEPRARLPERRDRGRPGLAGAERRRRPRLVVVLDEAHEPLLVAGVARQVPVHGLGALVQQPVVQALVVAVVESLLLERVLEVPVRLGHEDEVGVVGLDRRDHGRPVLVCRAARRLARPRSARRRRSSSASPCRSGRRRTGRRSGRACRSPPLAARARTRSAARRRATPGSRGRGRSRGRCRRRARTTPGSRCRSSSLPRTKYSGCVAVHGWSGATWFGTKSRISFRPRAASASRAAARPSVAAELGGDRVVADAVRRADDVRRACSRAARAGSSRRARRFEARSRPRPGCAPRRPSARPRRSRAPRSRPTLPRAHRRARRPARAARPRC